MQQLSISKDFNRDSGGNVCDSGGMSATMEEMSATVEKLNML